MTRDPACRCGHPKSAHTRVTGPNSNGQFFHGECVHGWHRSTGHLFEVRGACPCDGFRLRWWKPWRSR
jgi:hypothetical protein